MTSQLCVLVLLLINIMLLRKTLAITLDDFYPFGLHNGDNQLKKADDENNESVVNTGFNSSFKFFGKPYNIIGILTNGLLSLNHSDVSSNFSPKRFPTNGTLIAPFWADADTRGTGQVYYRSTDNQTLLQKMAQDINETIGETFFPEYLFVSTWHEVGYYNRNTDKTNTFQCVLATDHTTSYILFLYEKGGIQWARGEQIRSNSGTGYATVGFNADDGENYEILPGSNTANVVNIANMSNVGITGLWVFQVNQAQVEDPCTPHQCDANANCTKLGVSSDYVCTCNFPYSGNGTVCTVMTTTATVTATMLNTNTNTENNTITDDITTNSEILTSPTDTTVLTDTSISMGTETSLTDSTTPMTMANESFHMDSKVTNRVITPLLVLLGILLLLMLPGAIYGFIKVTRTIVLYEIKTMKDPAASFGAKYIIIGETTL